jgi:ABC-type glycerol-3-phosphate transport system substrate-binding protein
MLLLTPLDIDPAKMVSVRILTLGLLVACMACASSASSYKAAVVEHVTYSGHAGDTVETIKNKNLDIYQLHVEAAAKQKVQLIVFPEYGLVPGNMAFL